MPYKIITTPRKWINDSPYKMSETIDGVQYVCPLYMSWRDMIARIGTEGYEDCTVISEWSYFSVFREWAIKHYTPGSELDKDVLVPGNRHYSPDTCAFITNGLNTLFRYIHGIEGELPMGVSQETEHRRRHTPYRVRLKIRGKRVHIGRYRTVEEAVDAYLHAKADYILELAREELDKRVLPAVEARIDDIRTGKDVCYTCRWRDGSINDNEVDLICH